MTETDKLIQWILNAQVELAAQRRELASDEHLAWLETMIFQARQQLSNLVRIQLCG